MKKRKIAQYVFVSTLILTVLGGTFIVGAEYSEVDPQSEELENQKESTDESEETLKGEADASEIEIENEEVENPAAERVPVGETEDLLTEPEDNSELEMSEEPGNSQERAVPTSGTWGTCEWDLSAGGVFTIGEGNLDIKSALKGLDKSDVTKIVLSGKILAPENSLSLFANYPNLKAIENLANLDTSQVVDAKNMFAGNGNLLALDCSSFDTSNMTNMYGMFKNAKNLVELDVRGFNTSKVTDMSYMFYYCSSLSSLDVSSFNTSKVGDMDSMFKLCLSVVELDLSNFITSGGSNGVLYGVETMFQRCDSLTTLDIRNFDMRVCSCKQFLILPKLNCLTLGEHTSLYDPYGMADSAWLPEIKTDNGKYTGAWVNTEGTKVFASSKEFMLDYNGATDAGTYIWQLAVVGPVTVKYVNEQGSELAQPDTITGGMGETYTTKGKEIPGYQVKETPNNASGTFSGTPQTVTYVYKARVEGEVTVNYVDQAGKALATADVLKGPFGTVYTTEAKVIRGYEVVETKGEGKGIYTEAMQSVTYVYQAAQGAPVTVQYEDTRGTLIETVTLTGKYGASFTSDEKIIDGYMLKTAPTKTSGTFTDEPQTLTYVYQGVVAPPVTVKYLNQLGNDIAASTTLTGQVGMTYTATAKTPSGYTLVETPGNATGSFGTEPQTVTFRYKGNEAPEVTVEYVNADGLSLASPKIISGGRVGDAYTTEAATIQGYTVSTSPENATGFRTQSAMTVTYVYTKNGATAFSLPYVGVQQQQIAGFIPEGVQATKVTLLIKKAGTSEWTDTGYSAVPEADTGYFALESRFVKGTRTFLLENQDQVKVVFTAKSGEDYEGTQEVQPYHAPIVNDYVGGEEFVTGQVDPGVNQVRLLVNGEPMRVVNAQPFSTDGAGINAITGEFTIWGKTWLEGSNGIGRIHQTKVGDVITIDYGVQIYGALNNPATTIEVK